MELKKPSFTERWIFPLESEPETGVLIKKLSDAETNRIFDRNQYMPGSKGMTMAKTQKVLEDVVRASVRDWKGFQQDGVDIPCNDETKTLLLDATVEDGSVDENGKPIRPTLWSLVNKKFGELEEADRKN